MNECYQEFCSESEHVGESRAQEIEDGVDDGEYSAQDVFDLVQEVKRLRALLDVGNLPDPKVTGHEYKKTASVFAERMDKPFLVETLEGVMRGEAGDYLCEGPAGERWPIKKVIFEATYEKV